MTRKRKAEASTTSNEQLSVLADYAPAAEATSSSNGHQQAHDHSYNDNRQSNESYADSTLHSTTELVRYLEQMSREEPDKDVGT